MPTICTKDSILEMFRATPLTDIRKNFTREQLADMFQCLYGERPISRANKSDIINCISAMQRQIDRAAAFRNLKPW